ncbi:MAG: phospholipid carrier-dependent glycosyltransferase [Verrucomicrobiota bacterium]|nr:phospholipid carrier-dependent glycosyltransferase [Verrucomicrobiota bacterium]
MEAANRRGLIGFSIALAAEVALCASLNLFDDWTLEEMPVKFVACALLCGLAYFAAVGAFPIQIHPKVQSGVFWAVVIALRLVALPLAPGDDFWRYQWEGKIQQAGFNPYVNAPDDPQLEVVRAEFPEWHKINHRDFRAIYPPGAELLFAGLSRISDSPLLYKLLFAAADIATIAVLLRLFQGAHAPSSGGRGSASPNGLPSWNSTTLAYANAAWYAWNPLVVYSFAGAAHFDSLMILPMVAAIVLLTRFESETESRRKWWLALAAATAFGIAISIKLVPAFLLLCCVFALGYRAITLALSAAIPLGLSLLYGYPAIPIWDSLGRFAHVTRLNDLFWWLIEETIWPNPHQKNYHYNVILLIAVAVVSLLAWWNWKRAMLWVLGAALIFSPVLHPWYCTWILPLATWRRAFPWHVLSITLFAYFLFWNERIFALPWHSEPWLRVVIIGPPLVSAVWMGLAQRARRPQHQGTS